MITKLPAIPKLSVPPIRFSALAITLLTVLLLAGCGSGSNKKSSSASSLPSNVSSSVISSVSSAVDTSSSSTAESSAASSNSGADLSFGFTEGIEGWYLDGSDGAAVNDYVSLEHDAVNGALQITPLDWSANADTNYLYQARLDLDEPVDLNEALVEFVVSVPQSYVDDGGLAFQIITTNAEVEGAASKLTLPASKSDYGSYILLSSLTKGADGFFRISRIINMPNATRIALQIAEAPNDQGIKDAILIMGVNIQQSAGSSSSASSESSSTGGTADNVTVYDFVSDLEGWRNDYGHPVAVAHNATQGAAEITPDWSRADQNIIKEIPGTDFTGAKIEYVVHVTAAQVAAGLKLQAYVQTGAATSYTRLYGPIVDPVEGDNTLVFSPAADADNHIQVIERIALQLNGPLTGAAATDKVLLKEVRVTLAGSSSSESSSSVSVSSASSVSSSSSVMASSSSNAANATVYDFVAGLEGWRNDYDHPVAVTHNATQGAAEITPDWSKSDQNIIREISSTNFTGAKIEYVVNVTAAQVAAGLKLQGYVQTGEATSYQRLYGAIITPVAGDNTLEFFPAADADNYIRVIERIALQLNGPVTGAAASDKVLLKKVTVTLAGGSASSSSVSSSIPGSSSVASSSSSNPPSSSSSTSSSSTSVAAGDLSYGFSEGITGWYINGEATNDVTVTANIALDHNQTSEALEILPLDWTNNEGSNWRYQARMAFAETLDLSNSSIEYVVAIPEAYITDGGLSFQFIIHTASDDYGLSLPIANLPAANGNGDYVIGRNINVAAATGIGFQLASAPSDTDIKEPILIKAVYIDRPEAASSGSSSSSTSSGPVVVTNFELDTVGTTYGATAWNASDLDATVVTLASIDDLPTNGSSLNVLKVAVSNYNAVPKFLVTLPDGKTLADYDVHADIYFPVNSVGVSGDGDNSWKTVWLFANTTLSNPAHDVDNPGYLSGQSNGDYHDQWHTFVFTVDQAKAEALTGSIELALGISRRASADVNDAYYIDNIHLVEID